MRRLLVFLFFFTMSQACLTDETHGRVSTVLNSLDVQRVEHLCGDQFPRFTRDVQIALGYNCHIYHTERDFLLTVKDDYYGLDIVKIKFMQDFMQNVRYISLIFYEMVGI